MKRIITAALAALTLAVVFAAPASAATTTDSCYPWLTSAPRGNISVYPYGSGRQVHYATQTPFATWSAYRVYVNGIRVYPASEGYANLPDYRGITVKHVWRNVLSGITDSCTNTA